MIHCLLLQEVFVQLCIWHKVCQFQVCGYDSFSKAVHTLHFYDEFCREIAAKTTEEGMEDMLLTTRAYVQCNGDFKKTAKKLKQHENTIRYRINRLRNYLVVEEQPLLFHEIISLAVRIESMLEIKKNKEV